MAGYASNTNVGTFQSQQEIQSILRRYGADGFGVFERQNKAFVVFEYKNLSIKIDFDLPTIQDFTITQQGRSRSKDVAEKALEQEIKRRWRSMTLILKARMEAIDSGFSTIEKEFLSNIQLPNGQTIGDALIPKLTQIAETGQMPKLLTDGF